MAAVTRLGLYGGPRGLYGDFSGKTEQVIVPEPEETPSDAWVPGPVPGSSRRERKRHRQWREQRRLEQASLEETLEAAYIRATGEAVPEPVLERVIPAANRASPPSARRTATLPAPSRVNFEAMASDIRAAEALVEWYEALLERDDEEGMVLLL
jgi:hypothetical protein